MDRIQVFLHVLGYQGLMGTWFNGLGIAPALGVMAGLGELSRLNRLISPEYGPLQRIFKIVTDLPLAPTKPINAGIMDFCRTCKVCAEKCPADVLSRETEPSWEPVGPWNNPGHKTWYEDSTACRTWWARSTMGCITCFGGAIIGTLTIYVGVLQSPLLGASLMAIFALGVAIPFILAAVMVQSVPGFLDSIQRWQYQVQVIATAIVLLFGLVMVTDNYHTVSDIIYPYLGLG